MSSSRGNGFLLPRREQCIQDHGQAAVTGSTSMALRTQNPLEVNCWVGGCAAPVGHSERHFFFPDPSGYPGDGPHLCCPCPTSEEGEGPEQRSLFVLRPEVSTRAFSHTPLTHVAIPSCRGSWKVEPNRAVVCVTIIMEEGDDCLISATDVWRKLFSFLSILLGEAFY